MKLKKIVALTLAMTMTLGLLASCGKKDPEPKFILDGDFSVLEKEIAAGSIAGHLSNLHEYAVRLFNAAVSQELKNAMGPTPIG